MSELKGKEYKRFENIKHIRDDGTELFWNFIKEGKCDVQLNDVYTLTKNQNANIAHLAWLAYAIYA